MKNSLIRGFAAPRVKSAVMLFNLFYTHLYSLSRNDLRHQIGKKLTEKTILPYAE
jgi:hypothetical protein